MMLFRSLGLRLCTVTLAVAGVAPTAGQAGQAGPATPLTPTTFTLAPGENVARYRVQERLVGVDLPGEAIGATSAITGAIVLDAAGRVVAAQSKITVDITGLKSDSDARDRVIQGRTLHTSQFPTVDIVPKELAGLKHPWPASGELKFELRGDLTIHGVTKPWTWQVVATPKADGLAGRATTSFAFGDFGMTAPTSFRVLSVEDKVTLEYDFHFVPKR
jgi:polyisoprenoid-binding protein YceI